MLMFDFRAVCLPYCIDRLEDGRHVVLNRRYKPLGFITLDHVIYDEYPIASEIIGLDDKLATKLSWNGNSSLQRIYLYNDDTNPITNEENMNAYLERLKILATLKMKRR